MPSTKQVLLGVLGLGLTVTGLGVAAPPAQADVSSSIGTYPYEQPWSNTGLITANDDWSGVAGVQGYLGDDASTTSSTIEPQGAAALLASRSVTTDVNNNALVTSGTGGVLEIEGDTIAIQGSGTADYPNLVFRLDLTGKSGATFAFDARDLDVSVDNAIQQIAVHYRVGSTGDFTNLPAGYIADATTSGSATQVTGRSVALPAATDDQASVFVRVMTTNASGNDELVGIDNINITAQGGGGEPDPLEATSPGDKTGVVGSPITPFTMAATGGTSPYTWAATGLPNGVGIDATTGEVTGTPTAACTCDVTVTATDSAATPATDDVSFTFTVAEPAAVLPIAEIQGTGARSPFAPESGNDTGETVTTEGVVTAMYRTGGFNGMYIQTGGTGGATDATPGASDAIFVFGSHSMPDGVQIGDSVRVTGAVSDFGGTTAVPDSLTEITPSAGGVTELASALDPVTALATAYPTTYAEREAHEGELLAPTGQFTVTNVFNLNNFAEIGLATGDRPLMQPTELYRDDAPELQSVKDDNRARAVALDDGASINFLSSSNNNANKNIPLPWLSPTNPIRVGAEATFHAPVIMDFRNSAWKFQPTTPVTGEGAAVATFENTRLANQAPAPVGGDLQIATFNVLNYFNTTGEAYDALPNTGCTWFDDREGNHIGVNQCGTPAASNGNGPRGAATQVSFARQQGKIVKAINILDADIVGLEEIENSIKLLSETNRDDAVAALVAALNADAGTSKWAYVKSPGEAAASTAISEQDVIRPAFIYQPASVAPVGSSDILFGTTEFANAREPLAQAFKPADAPDSEAFAVIVNHFKSKGDSNPPATGDNSDLNDTADYGAFNGDRTRQATRLAQFAQEFADARGIEAIFLAGDINSYTHEDPMHALYDAGFTAIESDDEHDETYSFSGLSGSLDHFLGNDAAMAMVTGADIWEINADESVAFQYSRHNYNVTQFFDGSNPFAASDHNPEIVGLDVPDYTPDTTTKVQILGTNDFHGRLLANGQEGGAAILSGAVKELRGQNPNTVFAAAGDLIGASTFESFIQDDKPTIDALNEAGLEVSAAGNHEFDQGYEDLVDRVMQPYHPDTNPTGGAEWDYIAANVIEPDGRDELAETWVQDFGGIRVGFVGAVTEDLPALVSPSGIEGLTVTDIVDATNSAAADLRAGGADVVVLLVHEGSPSTDCSSSNFTDPSTAWGNITQNVSADVDAIISGHTHLAYNCSFPVQDWVDDDRAVTKRPVVSSGQYGTNLNQLVFSIDGSGQVAAVSQDVVGLGGAGWTADPAVTAIVNDAVAKANELGAQVLGQIEKPFNRAKLSTGAENRGGESTLGNLVAEVQRWATENPESGSAQIAFMNPGGLRADMAGTVNGSARDVTYKQAASVQPFANTLINMDLTGAQIETVLEQQWQRDSSGNVPSRPFLRLGVSEGFTYTYVETVVSTSPDVRTGEVTGMWLNGVPIDPAATYSVTANSFLASGGDNFREFANGTSKADTGKVDLQAMVDYMAEFAPVGTPLPADASQRAVEVEFAADAPAVYAPGDTVAFDVASWTMSTADDVKDTAVTVKLGDDVLGTAPLNNTIGTAVYDAYGTASVSVPLPANMQTGDHELTLVGAQTGTEIPVPISVERETTEVQILGTNDFHGRLLVDNTTSSQNCSNVACPGAIMASAVKQLRTQNPNTVFAAAGDLIGASTFESFIAHDKPTIDVLNEAGLEVSSVGNHEFDQGYEDLVDRVMAPYDADTNPHGGAAWHYLAANVEEPDGRDELAETWTKDFDGVTVGFVGAVTEELPALVSPSGIEGVTVTDIVDATNAAAADLRDGGADVVVLLVHEGSPSTSCGSPNFTDPSTVWGNITQNVSSDVDAIVSGHTHLAYNCSFAVQDWVDQGRTVTERPVVSSGQYGQNLNKLVFTVDSATGAVTAKTQTILPLAEATYGEDPATASIINAAKAESEVLGAQVLGQIQAPLNRAKLSGGTTENRGGESTLGNMVAEVQRWATETPATGSAQIAFMNPGGLRTDMAGTVNGSARDVTYKQAAVVQPFANTLINMDLTGAQIETVLEQQWQRDSAGNVPSRRFLRLGVSEGFTYTYVETPVTVNGVSTFEGEITGMWLDGEPIDPAAAYSVTVNSFLASGGDNFRELANGTGRADTGKVDLQAMVDYLAEFAPVGTPLPVDYSQRAVEVHNVADGYSIGQDLTFNVESWTMSTADDVKDTEVVVKIGDTVLGTAALDNTIGTETYDQYGKALVDVPIPSGTPYGEQTLTLVGVDTGTEVKVPVVITRATPTVTGTDVTMAYGRGATMHVTVTAEGGLVPTGRVSLKAGDVVLGSGLLTDGETDATIAAKRLGIGTHEVTVAYAGDGAVKPGRTTATVTVTKATPTVVGTRTTVEYGNSTVVPVRVGAVGLVPTGTVELSVGGVVIGNGTLTNGMTGVDVAAESLLPGTHSVTISYSGDDFVKDGTGTVTLVVQKATSTVEGTDTTQTYGQTATMPVTVTTATGVVPTGGKIVLKSGDVVLGSGTVVDGAVTVTLARNRVPASGTPYDVIVRYTGDPLVKPGNDTVQLTVNP